MRATTQHLRDMLNAQVSTLATCWRLERIDGQVFRWTDHDESLTIDGEVYDGSWSGGFDKSAIESNLGLGPTDLEVVGFLGAGLKRIDVEAGRFDGAAIRIFMVDWTQPSTGTIELRHGTLGEVVIADQHTYKVEIRGLAAPFTQTIGEVYSPECRANFCDKRCQLDINHYTHLRGVATITDMRRFTLDAPLPEGSVPAGMFSFGIVTSTSGENAGLTREIKSVTGTQVVLKFPFPVALKPGDQLEVAPGCDQRKNTCKAYGNFINFRGEPYVPGSTKIYQNLSTRR